jgi:hypothetical protein
MLEYGNEPVANRRHQEGRARAGRRGRSRRRFSASGLGRALARGVSQLSGATIGYALILGGYFIWICLQMAGHAVGGAPLVGAIFGGELLGVCALAVGLALTKRGKR